MIYKGRVVCFDKNTGNGRLKVLNSPMPYLDYTELTFGYYAMKELDSVCDGQHISVDVREIYGIPYVHEVRRTA